MAKGWTIIQKNKSGWGHKKFIMSKYLYSLLLKKNFEDKFAVLVVFSPKEYIWLHYVLLLIDHPV